VLAWAQEGVGENTRYADNARSVPELAIGKRRARMVDNLRLLRSPVAATPRIARRIARAARRMSLKRCQKRAAVKGYVTEAKVRQPAPAATFYRAVTAGRFGNTSAFLGTNLTEEPITSGLSVTRQNLRMPVMTEPRQA
jgi:hypothetical protein